MNRHADPWNDALWNDDALAAQLAADPAAFGEAGDHIAALLRENPPALAHPPPDLAARIVARLPPGAPVVVARRQRRRVQLARWAMVVGAGLLLLVLLPQVLGLRQTSSTVAQNWGGLQSEWGRLLTRFTLVAKSLFAVGSFGIAALLVATGLCVVALIRPRPMRGMGITLSLLTVALVIVVTQQFVAAPTIHSLRRSLVVDGVIQGDVVSLFGDITVRGSVTGDVTTLGGRVRLAPAALVGGSILSGVDAVNISPRAVGGAITDGIRPLSGLAQFMPANAPPQANNISRLAGVLAALVVLALAVFWVMLLPHQVRPASEHLLRAPVQAVMWGGAASAMLVGIAVAVSLVLGATLVGVVLMPLVLVAAHVPYIQGVATVGQALGQRLTGANRQSGAYWGIALQMLLVLALALWMPLASLVAFYSLGSLGLGAVVAQRRGS